MIELKKIGTLCKIHRYVIGKKQKDVAADTGYSREAISAFENGRANNAALLLWYVGHGLQLPGWEDMLDGNS